MAHQLITKDSEHSACLHFYGCCILCHAAILVIYLVLSAVSGHRSVLNRIEEFLIPF